MQSVQQRQNGEQEDMVEEDEINRLTDHEGYVGEKQNDQFGL